MYLDSNALAGRRILLTGASGGIGAATAATLAASNASVVAQFRGNHVPAETALADLPDNQRLLLRGDLATPEGARKIWDDALAWKSEIDVVVLNAAIMTDTPLDGTDEGWDAGWRAAMDVNVIGVGALMRSAAQYFVERGGGTIIVMSSWAAEQGSRIDGAAAYAASKAAIRNLGQTLARNYARQGLRVHMIAPGVVDSGMGVGGQDADSLRGVADGLAMGAHVNTDEIAELIAFLATDACPSLTGSTLDINGASYLR